LGENSRGIKSTRKRVHREKNAGMEMNVLSKGVTIQKVCREKSFTGGIGEKRKDTKISEKKAKK